MRKEDSRQTNELLDWDKFKQKGPKYSAKLDKVLPAYRERKKVKKWGEKKAMRMVFQLQKRGMVLDWRIWPSKTTDER